MNNDFIPKDDDGATIEGDGSYIETWKAMEELVINGLTKSIGVSNFNKRQIEDILSIATVAPVNNQVYIYDLNLFKNHSTLHIYNTNCFNVHR